MHAQHAALASAVVAHFGAHVVHAGDDFARQLQQPRARGCQLQPARMALEQRRLELMLQQLTGAGSPPAR